MKTQKELVDYYEVQLQKVLKKHRRMQSNGLLCEKGEEYVKNATENLEVVKQGGMKSLLALFDKRNN